MPSPARAPSMISRVRELRSAPEGTRRDRGASRRVSSRETAWNDPLRRRMLAAADLLAAFGAAAAAAFTGVDTLAGVLCALAIAPIWVTVAKIHGLYGLDHARIHHLTVDEVPRLFYTATLSTAANALLFSAVEAAELPAHAAIAMGGAGFALAFLFRATARVCWRQVVPPERGLVIGDGPIAQDIVRKLGLERGHHLVIVRSVEGLPPLRHSSESADPADELEEIVQEEDVDRLVVALQDVDEQALYRVLALCRRHRLKLSVAPPIQAMLGTAVSLTHLAELPVIEFKTWDPSRSTVFLKRAFDIAVAGPTLLALAPLIAFLALLVRLDSRGPVFYVQTRAGRGGAPFRMVKFRTMVADADARLPELVQLAELPEPMYKLRSDPRVTRVGRFLRRTSLDELPQLLNVLRGQMSLVGPRPEDVRLVDTYTEAEVFRLDMRPGMTGPMQVHGRGELSFRERLAVEREYIENYSFASDIDILLRTAAAVFRGRGAF
jgi:exopolysaccharide biosynthesis polyprenyl glycosylphosphotransferase